MKLVLTRAAGFLAATLAALLLSVPSVSAQSYSIDWFTIDGGGGSSTGGVFSVSGTIGQPDAGHLSSGNFSLEGGFWGIIAAVQTPGSPLLSVAVASANHVALSWVSSAAFRVQQNLSLANTNGWSTVNTNTFPIVVSNGTNTITLPVSGNQFFRLVTP